MVRKISTILIVLIVIVIDCYSQVRLPRLIGNGMILQRAQQLNIWGWAEVDEKVTVSFKGKAYSTRTDSQGKWIVHLPAQKAGGPFSMVIKGSNEIKLDDILIGDVWVCAGQSNMELPVERVKDRYAAEVASANNTQIRQFLVPDMYNFKQPQDDFQYGDWLPADSKHIGGFSAVAWFFAKEVYKKNHIPIGLINTALGGSPAEAWISEDSIRKFPAAYAEVQKFKDGSLIQQIEKKDQDISRDWYKRLYERDKGTQNNWTSAGLDDSNWPTMNVPGYWNSTPLGNANGSVWFRKKVNISQSAAGLPARLLLGRIVDADSVFVNGIFAGTTGYQYPPRRYSLPANVLHEGENTITIRVISNSGKGGFVLDKPYKLVVGEDSIDLRGEWSYQQGAVMEPLPGQTFIRWKPVGLFNAMIAPLREYPVKGVIWYQGEANTADAGNYRALMTTLINNWRTMWGQRDLPFIYVQLANFMEAKTAPSESNWAALRQAQLETLKVPGTGMAVATDLGDWNDIHPENKKEVGHRLALQAQYMVYGDRKMVYQGPVIKSIKAAGADVILDFTSVGSGLVAKGNTELKHFAVAGADKKFVWAKAIIKGNQVIVRSDKVPAPLYLRYAWADNPEGANLYNKEGLPASPFRADIKAKQAQQQP